MLLFPPSSKDSFVSWRLDEIIRVGWWLEQTKKKGDEEIYILNLYSQSHLASSSNGKEENFFNLVTPIKQENNSLKY